MKNPLEQALEEVQIILAQGGDTRAFERLIDRYHPRLVYYVRRLVEEEEAVRDILQNVWLDAYRQLRRLRAVPAFSVWLYRIARNKAVEHLRHEARYMNPEDEIEILAEPTEEPEVESFDAARIHEGLQKLKLEHRDVLVLHFLEEMPYERIAEVAGCPVGTVRSRMYYAKRALRAILEEDHDRK